MNKNDLIEAICEKTAIPKKMVSLVLNAYTNTITEVLSRGGKVSCMSFGTYTTSIKPERAGVNPQTRAPIRLPQVRIARFRPGKFLREKVRGSTTI